MFAPPQFDDFLKRNDEEVQAAVGGADEEARTRQDKVSTPLVGWKFPDVGYGKFSTMMPDAMIRNPC